MVSELDNIRSVLSWSVEADQELGLHLVIALNPFWISRERLTEARLWMNQLLTLSSPLREAIAFAREGF